jgi:glycine/serine hydroxymethyltransferase
MPIPKEKRQLYPPDWKQISQRIRFERGQGCCERCGIPHDAFRIYDPAGVRITTDAIEAETARLADSLKVSRIILTTAHLSGDVTDNSDSNLAALCQRCHLRHDLPQHLKSRKVNWRKRTGQQLLIADL